MENQPANREKELGTTKTATTETPQYSLRSLFVVTSSASVWMGAWAWMDYCNSHSNSQSSLQVLSLLVWLAVVLTCPFALFGYTFGRAKAGIIAGLITTALIVIFGMMTAPGVE
jgi:hypothetical protein